MIAFFLRMRRRLARVLFTAAAAALPVLAFAHGISAEDRERMLSGGYLQYVGLGATHMLSGYDHLLFLFGVVFFLTTFKDVAKFVTVFTLGHCITLILATYFTDLTQGRREILQAGGRRCGWR